MSSFFSFLATDDFYSPLALVVGGALTLVFLQVLRRFEHQTATRLRSKGSVERFQELMARFEQRARVSWALIGFGLLWTVEVVVERVLVR